MSNSKLITPTRRNFLRMSGAGFGGLALSGLLASIANSAAAADLEANNPLAPKRPPLPAKAQANHFSLYGRRDVKRRYV